MTISVFRLTTESFLLTYKLQRAAMIYHNVIENQNDLKDCQSKLRRSAAAMVEIVKDWKQFSTRQGALAWIDKEIWFNVGCKFSATQILDGKFYTKDDFIERLKKNHGDLPRDEEIG